MCAGRAGRLGDGAHGANQAWHSTTHSAQASAEMHMLTDMTLGFILLGGTYMGVHRHHDHAHPATVVTNQHSGPLQVLYVTIVTSSSRKGSVQYCSIPPHAPPSAFPCTTPRQRSGQVGALNVRHRRSQAAEFPAPATPCERQEGQVHTHTVCRNPHK